MLHSAGGHQGNYKAHQAGNQKIDDKSALVQVSKPLPEPMLNQIYVTIWRH